MPIRLKDLHEQEPILTPGMEALNLVAMSGFISNFFGKLFSFFDTQLMPSHISGDKLIQAQKYLAKYPAKDLEMYKVFSPEYLKGPVEPFLKMLSGVLDELKDINKDMLDPLEKWAATMLTDPRYGLQAWTTIPIKLVEVEKHKAELKKYFNETTGEGIDKRYIYDVYKNNEGLNTVTKLLEPMVVICANLLDGKLKAKANNINSLIGQLVNNKQAANNIEMVPDEKLKAIVDLTRNVAESLELLSIVMFHVKCASYAHEESLTKISRELVTHLDRL